MLERLVGVPRARRASLACCAVACCALGGSSCRREATSILVVVDTDFDVPSEVSELHVEVQSEGDTDPARREVRDFAVRGRSDRGCVPMGVQHCLPLSFTVSERPSRPAGASVRVTVTARRLVPGVPEPVSVVDRSALLGFQSGRAVAYGMFLPKACVAGREYCRAMGQVCTERGCQSERVPSEQLVPYTPGGERSVVPTLVDGGPVFDGGAAMDAAMDAGTDAGDVEAGLRDASADASDAAQDARDGAPIDGAPLCDGGPCGSYTIRAGSHSACALRRPVGEIWCWGENGFGQLGRGFVSAEDGGVSGLATPAPVVDAMGAPLRGFAGVTVGAGMACAYNTSNQVYCWGRNSELWTDDENTEVLRPSRVSLFDTLPSMGGIVDISTIVGAVFVRYANGAVVSFGSRYNSAVADGLEGQAMASPLRSPEVGAVAGLANVRSVSSTYTNVGYAVASSGALLAWGQDANGRFGTLVGRMVEPGRPVLTGPTAVPGVTRAVSAIATINFACALDEGRTVRCWGYNADNAVDPAQPIDTVIRTPVVRADIGSSIVALSAAGPAVLALDASGAVRCFGGTYDSTCPVGPGMGAATTVRGFGPGAPRIEEIAGGFDFACARASDQRVWCWGRNQSHQCASTTATMVPATAPALVALPAP